MQVWKFLSVCVSYQIFQSHFTLFNSPAPLPVSQTVVLKVRFGIFSYLTASWLPLLASLKDKNYPVKSNYRSSEWNLASAARKQLRTYNWASIAVPAVCNQSTCLFRGISYCIVQLLTEYIV